MPLHRWALRRFLIICCVALVAVASGATTTGASAFSTTPTQTAVPNGTVYAIARSGSTVYLGGDFTAVRDPVTGATLGRSHLAAVDAATGRVTSWNPGANATVRALAVGSDGTIFAGGSFTAAAGAAALQIAAISPAGGRVAGWQASTNGPVRDLAVSGTGLYVAGTFGAVNGKPRPRLARVSTTTGAVDLAFDAKVGGGSVYTVLPAAGSLFLGGSFTSLSGASRGFAGAVSPGSGAVTGWAPASGCANCPVLDLATDGTNVYEAIGGGGNRTTAVTVSGARRVWSKQGDGDVQALAVQGGVVYAGGHFSNFDGGGHHQLVALSASNGALRPYTVGFSGSDGPGVWAVTADSTSLRIGGGFTLANGAGARYAVFAN